eukprot:scaffold48054_cov72-Phaeocystis_antarctica.AAC.1
MSVRAPYLVQFVAILLVHLGPLCTDAVCCNLNLGPARAELLVLRRKAAVADAGLARGRTLRQGTTK